MGRAPIVLALAGLALSVLAVGVPEAGAQQGPVIVNGDSGFSAALWSGDGNASNPYRPNFLSITPSGGRGLELVGTTKHVNISGVVIAGGGSTSDGIHLYNVRNVTVWGSTLESNRWGIHVRDSSGVQLLGNTVKTSAIGVHLEGSNFTIVSDNRLSVNDANVRFQRSPANTLLRNNLSIATGQIGLSFADNASYDNQIDTTNVVNGAPVRWYVRANGTPSAPRVITIPLAVDLPGITDVAQIMVVDSAHLRIEGAVARAGSASGIHVHRGRNVEIVAPVADGNLGSGIFLEVSPDARIAGAVARNNTVAGILLQSSANADLASITATGNGQAGVRAIAGGSARLDQALLEGQTIDGLDVGAGTSVQLQRSTLRGNGGFGVRAAGPVTLAEVAVIENVAGGALFGANASISSSEFEDNANVGLRATAAATIADVSVIDNAGDGMTLEANATVARAYVGSNGKAGIRAVGAPLVNVSRSNVSANGEGGIVAQSGANLALFDNDLRGNARAGIVLSGAGGANRIVGNRIAEELRGIEIADTELAQFAANEIAITEGQTGFHFLDERSYNNRIPATNLVNGAPMQWYTALAGTESLPVRLPGLRSELTGITNVAQVMLYRSAYVEIDGAVAANGTARGIYLYRSAFVTLSDANVRSNALAGIHLHSTQSSDVRDILAQGSGIGVQITDSINNVVTGVNATGASTGVLITDAGSRDDRVDDVEVSGSARGVEDKGWGGLTLTGNNLLLDAGATKRAKLGENVTFADATATYRLQGDRFLEQTWSFGDGDSLTSDAPALFRPEHNYTALGTYRASLSARTASGLVLSDSVNVEIVAALGAPLHPNATMEEGGLRLNWSAPASDGGSTIQAYRLYRIAPETPDVEPLLLAEVLANETSYLDTAVQNGTSYHYEIRVLTAAEEGPPATLSFAVPDPNAPPPVTTEPTATPEGPRRPTRSTPPPRATPADTPGAGALAALAALGVAAWAARRRP